MRKFLVPLALAAGVGIAGTAAWSPPAEAASVPLASGLQASTALAVSPAIADSQATAHVQKVYWYWVGPRRYWRPGPAVVVAPAGPRWWWGGRYYYHRAWGPYGWRYW
jgi:hypothetical protein